MIELNELWFWLIAVLFVGFFFLEGFDFGVGMATRLLAKTNHEKRMLINTIGPFWDANEVWLITAAGAMFAAFPHWYSTMFSGFYLPLTVILLALIGRGVAFEFRAKVDSDKWRKTWDVAILFGSVVPPLVFGIMFAGMIKGLPIQQDMNMSAGLGDIVNGYSVWAGITVTGLCLLHGLTFISLRTLGPLRERARIMARRLLPVQAALLAVLGIWTYASTDFFARRGVVISALLVLGVAVFLLAGYYLKQNREGWAFGMTGGLIILTIATVFIGLFPRVMVSSIDSAFDLTVVNAASSPYTLKAMTIVVVCLLPFVLGYQIWSYVVFHKRISEKEHLEY
ncbi:cytochrome d ubiquinol oxidase subunit II [Paenibacillaceae bacterium]|nr:cytochrome d ubiquinol oxidase subunit II [Paenibacillaceae bacterium]